MLTALIMAGWTSIIMILQLFRWAPLWGFPLNNVGKSTFLTTFDASQQWTFDNIIFSRFPKIVFLVKTQLKIDEKKRENDDFQKNQKWIQE